MPREQARRLKPRSAVPSVEGKPKLTPQARPVDPYGVSGVSQGTQDLLVALDAVNKGAAALGKAGTMWAEEQGKKGARARAGGVERDDSKSNAFIAGYETMDGKYKAIEYKTALADYVTKNKHLTPDEFKAGLDALQKDHIGRLAHDGQLDSFIPDALQAEEGAWAEFQKEKRIEVEQEVVAKGQTLLQNDNSTATREGFAILGMTGIDDLTTAANLKKLQDNSAGVWQVWGRKMRDVLTKNQAEGAGVMPKQDWTERMYESTAADAIRYGAPELMAWAYEKDQSGVAAVNTADRAGNSYAQKVAAVIKQAEANRYTLLQRYENDEKEAKKEKSALESNDMLDRIMAASGDPAALMLIRNEFAGKKDWQTGDKRAINSLLDALETSADHPRWSDDGATLALHEKELRGSLTTEDVKAQRTQLTRGDYELWLGKVVAEKRRKETERKGENQIYFDPKQIAANNYSALKEAINPTEFGLPIDPDGAQKALAARDMFTRLMVEFQNKSNRAPEYSEQTQILSEVYKAFPPVDKNKLRQQLLGNTGTGQKATPPKDVNDFLARKLEFSAEERLKYIEKFKTELSGMQTKEE